MMLKVGLIILNCNYDNILLSVSHRQAILSHPIKKGERISYRKRQVSRVVSRIRPRFWVCWEPDAANARHLSFDAGRGMVPMHARRTTHSAPKIMFHSFISFTHRSLSLNLKVSPEMVFSLNKNGVVSHFNPLNTTCSSIISILQKCPADRRRLDALQAARLGGRCTT